MLKLSLTFAIFGLLFGCTEVPLDYETAISVVKDSGSEPVKVKFSATPRSSDTAVIGAYRTLADSHVLDCKDTAQVGVLCVPGAAGDILSQDGTADLTVVAGRWTPASIVAIQRTGRNSAQADVRMTFEPTSLYRDFESSFEAMQYTESTLALAERKQGKMMHASFQRYDDGWHLEALQ